MNIYLPRLALFCGAMSLFGCGGGGGSTASSPAPTAPSQPARLDTPTWSADSGAITRTAAPVASFNAPLDAGTVNTATVQVVGPDGDVFAGTASLSAQGKVLNWAAAAGALPGGTRYDMRLSTGLKGLDGGLLEAAVTKSFTVAPQQWSSVDSLAPLRHFTGGLAPTVVADSLGKVTALWYQAGLGDDRLMASRLDEASGAWSAPRQLNGPAVASIGGVTAATAPNGDVYVVWSEHASGPQTVHMARYSAASASWQASVPFSRPLPGNAAGGAAITIDAQSMMTVVFRTWTGNAMYALRYNTVTEIWGMPVRMDAPTPSNYTFNTRVLADQAGNVTVAWFQRGDGNGLHVRRYTAAASSWGPATIIEDHFLADPFTWAVDANGAITMAWVHDRSNLFVDPYVAVSVFDPATVTWSAPVRLSSAGYSGSEPSVVRARSGISTVVWRERMGAYSARLGAARGAAWSPARLVGEMAYPAGAVALGVDPAGNVTAVYPHKDFMMASRYSATTNAWEQPAVLGAPSGEQSLFANQAGVVVNASGDATAVWHAHTQQGALDHASVVTSRFR